MDTRQFLSQVWPSSGPYLLAIPITWTDKETGEKRKGFRHFPHDAIDDAVAHAHALANDPDAPQDVYFALGSIKENRKKHVRKAENIAALRAFWIDLDVEPGNPKKYDSQRQACESLRDFCQAMQLPMPHVINSGGGIHVYWPLRDALDGDKWFHYASLLKQIAASWGLKQDPSRTADRASVLRPVGTYNWKTGQPREVKPVAVGQVQDTDAFLAKLAHLSQTFALNAPAPAPKSVINIAAGLPAAAAAAGAAVNQQLADSLATNGPPSDAKMVVSRCQQLKWQALNQGEVDEPQWYDMVGCLRHCARGEEAVHRLSRGHPNYSATATDDKIAQHLAGGYGPTLCQTFEDHRPGGCAGCPHAGKIKSPIQLGKMMPAAPAPTAPQTLALAEEEPQQLPPPPYPFKRVVNSHTGLTQIVVASFDKDGTPSEDDLVYEYDLFPSRITFDERDNHYVVTVCRFLPKDGWAEFELPIGKLYDRKNLATTLGNIGVVPDLPKVEYLVQYMIAYIRDLQKQSAAATVYAQLGWRPDQRAFVLPTRLLSLGTPQPVVTNPNVERALSWQEPRGDINTWRTIASVFERPGMEAHQFGLGVGFGAPLLRFTNFSGVIVSMVGEAGCGKSSVAELANTIWGHRRMGWTDAKNDTRLSFYNVLGVLQHLPVTYDEITNLDPETLSDLCYAVSKGSGRRRLQADGTAKENYGAWQTMMLTTSNASLHAKLALAKADASAESVRIFEYRVPPRTLAKTEADALFSQLNDHFGLAGPIYVQYVLANLDHVRARVMHWIGEVDVAAQVVSSERFWSAAAGCVLAGFEAANACGLTNADLPRLMAFAVDCIKKMRGVVQETVRTPTAVVSDYLSVNIRNTMVIAKQPEPGKPTLIAREPSAELRVRYDAWAEKLYVDRAHFRKFVAERMLDPTQVCEELERAGVILGTTRGVMGKGTAFKSAQTYLLIFNTAHPELGGSAVALAPSPVAPVASIAGGNGAL